MHRLPLDIHSSVHSNRLFSYLAVNLSLTHRRSVGSLRPAKFPDLPGTCPDPLRGKKTARMVFSPIGSGCHPGTPECLQLARMLCLVRALDAHPLEGRWGAIRGAQTLDDATAFVLVAGDHKAGL